MRVPSLLRTIFTGTLLVLAAGLAVASETPDGYGVDTPSGSTFTTAIGNAADCDDFTFDGYIGQKVSAKLKTPKGSNLDALVELVRPDGTVVTVGQAGLKYKTKGATRKLSGVLDATGIWKVRVRRDPAAATDAYGEYSVKVQYAPPTFGIDKTTLPNPDSKQYLYAVPAVGGAEVGFVFKFKGGTPHFSYLARPDLQQVGVNPLAIKTGKTSIKGKKILIPDGMPLGNYVLGFDDDKASPVSGVKFKLKVKLPAAAKRIKEKLSSFEPLILGTTFPKVGGPGTKIYVETQSGIDPDRPGELPHLFVGTHELTGVSTIDGRNFSGVVPSSMSDVIGIVYDISLRTSTGQVVVRKNAFTRVPAPVVTGVSQPAGTTRGGFELTLSGSNFNTGKDNTGQWLMDILIDGSKTTIRPTEVTESSVTFRTIPWPAGQARFGVQDQESLLATSLEIGTFEFLSTASITRVTPNLSPTLGGELISVTGVQFDPQDTLYLEREDGSFELMPNTYQDEQRHSFTAPPRAKGTYEIYILDPQSQRTTGQFFLSYFSFADFTASSGLNGQVGADNFTAWTSFVGDYDGDGRDDLLLANQGSGGVTSQRQTRVLQNNGIGGFTDVTNQVIPAPTAADDWRADRIWLANISGDALPELLLATNSTSVPADSKSHIRLLENRRRTGGSIRDREFVDRSDELMPSPRTKTTFGGGTTSVADNWRAQDIWVGDIDNSGGVPDILLVHDELKNEPNVDCGNYCSSPATYPFQYHFYWGGARTLLWDPNARDGAGKFRFSFDFFPRKSGVAVAIAIPGGGTIVGCSTPCAGKFPPFIGQKIRVARIDSDGKLDIAVLSNAQVQAYGVTTSSLQVALNRPSTADGSAVTDVTPQLTDLGGDYRADSITVGQPFNFYGTIAISKKTAGAGSVLKLLQAKGSTVEGELIAFEDISALKLPSVTADDKWQAADMRFVDTNGDRLDDLVLLSDAPVGSGGMSFRILRSIVDSGTVRFEESFKSLLAPLAGGGDTFDGAVLQVGDLNGDGVNEYVITRSVVGATGGPSQTRVITTDLSD